MKSRKLRLGVIGTGGVFRGFHLHGWKDIPDAEIVAVADVNLDGATALAREYNVPHVFADYRELVKLDLDAVDICTPNGVHTPAVLAALQAGKHVLCEKPLATTSREVVLMGRLADRRKLKLMTAHHQRFTASAQAIKNWAAAGGLGRVYHARVRAMRRAWLPNRPGFIDRRLSGGGPCMDIGVHALDLCMWLMGFPTPSRVSGVTRVNFGKGRDMPNMWGEWDRKLFSVEDFAAGFVHFQDGATLTLESSWMGHQQENEDLSCQLFGLKGGVKWPSTEFATVQGRAFVQGTLLHPRRVDKPHWEELKAFHHCVTNNTPSPVPWQETLKVIAVLEAIYRSARQRREVSIKL
jgi:predicted dehydrogenase